MPSFYKYCIIIIIQIQGTRFDWAILNHFASLTQRRAFTSPVSCNSTLLGSCQGKTHFTLVNIKWIFYNYFVELFVSSFGIVYIGIITFIQGFEISFTNTPVEVVVEIHWVAAEKIKLLLDHIPLISFGQH